MSRTNLLSVAAVAALSAVVAGFAAPSAFASGDTKSVCCGMACCKPAASCCDSDKAVKKGTLSTCCAPGAACCQPGSACCASVKTAVKAKPATKKASDKASKTVAPKNAARA